MAKKIMPAPKGWMTNNGLADSLGMAEQTVRKYAEPYRIKHSGWFKAYLDKGGKQSEHYHPRLVSAVRKEAGKYVKAPRGWLTTWQVASKLGTSYPTVKRLADSIRSSRPELFRMFRDSAGRVTEHYHPKAIKAVSDLLPAIAPKGWLTNNAISVKLGVIRTTVERIANRYRDTHPEWFAEYRGTNKLRSLHYHPQLVKQIEKSLSKYKKAPRGWMTNAAVMTLFGVDTDTIKRMVEPYRKHHPEWIQIYKDSISRPREHFSPQLVRRIINEYKMYKNAPKGWVTVSALADELGSSYSLIEKLSAELCRDHPEWRGLFKNKMSRPALHYHPRLARRIKDHFVPDPQEGWRTRNDTAQLLGVDAQTVRAIADGYRESHQHWFKTYRLRQTPKTPREHFSPDLVEAIGKVLEQRRAQPKRKELVGGVKKFLAEAASNKTVEAKEFRRLLKLFGAERVVDLLYQYHPEYRGIPMPFVRGVLAEYLGEFLTPEPELDLDSLRLAVPMITDKTLRDGLVEVIKSDCLKNYNLAKRTNPESDDLVIIEDYIDHLRLQTETIATGDLVKVLDEVLKYYRSLFRLSKPRRMVHQIKPGRSFPDLNQRINIQEVKTKHRMLIADEMGVGKSASAILSKECLKSKLALILAPSNVVGVWASYLSDKVSEDGEVIGYFKPGRGPRVFVVEDLASLTAIDPSEFDYIIVSQERLNGAHQRVLSEIDYDMLIVDEVHKLKNIATGKRAENLIQLAGTLAADKTRHLILLSGTPVPNKVGDVAMVLRLLYPDKFVATTNQALTSQILQGDILDIRSLLVPRMQMKTLADSVDMPSMKEVVHYLQLSGLEKDIYEVLLEEDELTAALKIQTLRQFVLSPSLVKPTPGLEGAKIKLVRETLRKCFKRKKRIVMFFNGYIEGVIRGGDNVLDKLVPEGVEIRIIDGSVSKARRLEIQEELASTRKKLFLAVSGQTADVGVDFSEAEELHFYNEPWTEYDRRQQLGRVYRPGLKGPLTVHTYIAQATIEEGVHLYIAAKYRAVEKLLRGVPLSELEKDLLKHDEKQTDQTLDVTPELAAYYFSSWDRMLKIFRYVKQRGESSFMKFLVQYGREYAECYTDLGSRSYQANVSRLTGTVIDSLAKERKQNPARLTILDIASGPEMLRRHILERYADQVVSLDINPHHFEMPGGKRLVASFTGLPIRPKEVEYANLSLALHYSRDPRRKDFERVKVLQEMNQSLKIGGLAVICLIYSLDLKSPASFLQTMRWLGFRALDEYSGVVQAGKMFKTRLITLEKVHDCPKDTLELVRLMGPSGIDGLKFVKHDVVLRDSRRIVTEFAIGDRILPARFNREDRAVLREEQAILREMERLKKKHRTIEQIPAESLVKSGIARFFNGKVYVLFKRLTTGPGAVVIR